MPQVEGYGRLAEGTRAHERHGRMVSSGARLRAIGLLLALLGLLALVVALLLLLGVRG